MVVVSFSLPPGLLREFDKIITDRGYRNRSKGIRDALQTYITEHRALSKLTGEVSGIITATYDYGVKVEEEVSDIRHRYDAIIQAEMHLHLSEEKCLEIFIIQGEQEIVKELVDALQTTRRIGVIRHIITR